MHEFINSVIFKKIHKEKRLVKFISVVVKLLAAITLQYPVPKSFHLGLRHVSVS